MDRQSIVLYGGLLCAMLMLQWYEVQSSLGQDDISGFCGRFCSKYCQERSDLECDLCKECKCQAKACHMPKVEAPHCVRYYFDPKLEACTMTRYGYCKVTGKHNNFRTLEDCIRACPNPTQNLDCRLPKVVGSCEYKLARYYYNKETGKCETFEYSGCEGNANNYKSLVECEEACGMYKYKKYYGGK